MSVCMVTGGAGFIGSHLVDTLVNNNHEVIVVDNLSTGQFDNLNMFANLIHLDIRNKDEVDKLFDNYKFDFVFHLAAQINLRDSIKLPHIDADTNIIGTINILSNCKNIKKFIFSSTGGAIYSPQYTDLPWTENHLAYPQSPYGLSKFCAEKYIDLISKQLNFKYAILRLSNVYGPRQNSHGEAGVISIFRDKILESKSCTIFGDGTQTRDFVYVKDVVDAFIAVLHKNVGGIFNVSTAIETSINDLTNKIFTILNNKPNINYANKIDGELFRSCLSYEKFSKATNWKPKYTLDDGLVDTFGRL